MEITDVSAPVLGEMLRFIYTGNVEPQNLDEMAAELLATSDKVSEVYNI